MTEKTKTHYFIEIKNYYITGTSPSTTAIWPQTKYSNVNVIWTEVEQKRYIDVIVTTEEVSRIIQKFHNWKATGINHTYITSSIEASPRYILFQRSKLINHNISIKMPSFLTHRKTWYKSKKSHKPKFRLSFDYMWTNIM